MLTSVYHLGSSHVSGAFLEKLTIIVVHRCPVVAGSDFNVHVEDPSVVTAVCLLDLLQSMDIKQHMTLPTHRVCVRSQPHHMQSAGLPDYFTDAQLLSPELAVGNQLTGHAASGDPEQSSWQQHSISFHQH